MRGPSRGTGTRRRLRVARAVAPAPHPDRDQACTSTSPCPTGAARPRRAAVDGVGLLRAEFMLTEALGGRHPRELIAKGGSEKFVDVDGRLADHDRDARSRRGRWSTARRTSAPTSSAGSTAATSYEPVESNPMIGLPRLLPLHAGPGAVRSSSSRCSRGCARVTEPAPDDPVRAHAAGSSRRASELVDASPLGRQRGLHRWVMAEVPSVVYWLPEYAALGIDGVSIGSNDLTQLMLGVDRDSEICAELFDEADEAVLEAIERIVKTARRARDHVLVVRAGAVHPARLRRAPGADGDHLDLDQSRRHRRRPRRGRRGGAAGAAGRGDRLTTKAAPPVPTARAPRPLHW